MKTTKRNFVPVENDDNDYKKFINNISGGEPLPFETTIGYLIHKNKTPHDRAIILQGSAASGKGLFTQGLSKIIDLITIEAHLSSLQRPLFHNVTTETDLILIDDVNKDFLFENLYFYISSGLNVEQQGKAAFFIPHEESPKFIISTDHSINGKGLSFERRMFILKLSNHYNQSHSPIDDFGHTLFDDWDKDHLNRFENYMENCIQKYFEHGLVEQQISKASRKIIL